MGRIPITRPDGSTHWVTKMEAQEHYARWNQDVALYNGIRWRQLNALCNEWKAELRRRKEEERLISEHHQCRYRGGNSTEGYPTEEEIMQKAKEYEGTDAYAKEIARHMKEKEPKEKNKKEHRKRKVQSKEQANSIANYIDNHINN